ncbi:general L-amino acid transport system permease protein [Albimonas donghaensis]|uniref:General L-amino acid transport system permease protein n=1 Tax=Albimonas donghaensis TaxID=356660 RepID=A0A1H3D841_9RHOB|nr:amino acid ABC transporter permease [Albimonas donghaensis]SDX61849.1 general L-amino acid transport system permease protein [Albimonas donghaensis]
MSDLHSNTVAFVAGSQIPPSPPPAKDRGAVKWLRENMFSSVANGILTVIAALVIITAVPAILQWAFIDAVWSAGSLSECREIAAANGVEGAFACWAVINERFNQFLFGFYPNELLWRPVLAFVLMFVAMAPVLFRSLPKPMLWFSAAYPFLAYFLIWGGLGLEPVESSKIGGFLLALIIGVTGIVASLPFGVLLALGRKSDLFFIKTICVVFIEFIRGVPLITLLFVASSVLNYFFPPGTALDLILRVVIMATLFSSAYMAEVIRGGLAALPQGQYEAADSLGLDYWKSMRLIILPQALKISIPGIVNTFIGLFKDTTLVSVIGLLDPVGMITPIRADSNWNGLVWEFYVFVALFFFAFCFCMSRYSMYLEKKLKTDNH